jgi:hypothetical protein
VRQQCDRILGLHADNMAARLIKLDARKAGELPARRQRGKDAIAHLPVCFGRATGCRSLRPVPLGPHAATPTRRTRLSCPGSSAVALSARPRQVRQTARCSWQRRFARRSERVSPNMAIHLVAPRRSKLLACWASPRRGDGTVYNLRRTSALPWAIRSLSDGDIGNCSRNERPAAIEA